MILGSIWLTSFCLLVARRLEMILKNAVVGAGQWVNPRNAIEVIRKRICDFRHLGGPQRLQFTWRKVILGTCDT